MTKPLSNGFRQRLVEAVAQGTSCRAAAERCWLKPRKASSVPSQHGPAPNRHRGSPRFATMSGTIRNDDRAMFAHSIYRS